MKLHNLVDHQELTDELQSLDDLLDELQEEEEAAPVKTPEPRVHWRKRDSNGNIVYAKGQDQAGISQIRVRKVFHLISVSVSETIKPEPLITFLT